MVTTTAVVIIQDGSFPPGVLGPCVPDEVGGVPAGGAGGGVSIVACVPSDGSLIEMAFLS
jgi:hypothetical protein